MKNKKLRYWSVSVMGILFMLVHEFNPTIQDTSLFSPTGDTAAFRANQQAGWSIYFSYLSQDTPDSVEFEFVIQHADNINWANEQFIGVITKNDFKPATSQQLTYQLLLDNLWTVRIEPSGQVFLRHVKGETPPPNPIVIFPVQVKFKRT